MAYPLTMAKSISYGSTRNLASIKFVVLHYTGVVGDSAKNEVKYFSSGNTRSAGAHYFVGQDGDVQQSIPLKYTAWSVGDYKNGKGTYYGKCTNSNSVSIEMCDQLNKDASAAQIAAVKKLIAYIQSQCPNAKTIIRHYDVTTKSCPARYINASKWASLKAAVTGGTAPASNVVPDSTPEQLSVDGYVGNLTVRRWQQIMGTPVDGKISGQLSSLKKYHLRFTSSAIDYGSGGSQLIKAVQSKLGVTADGQMGPQTIKAIQTHVGAYPDGYFGRITAEALQNRLNTGSF